MARYRITGIITTRDHGTLEEVDEIPFVIWTPIRIPHRLTGLCPADAVL